MFKTLLPLTALAVSVCAASAFAQDTTTSETPAPEATASEQLLDLGQPVGDGPQLGERYAKSEHGDWSIACIKIEADTDPCSLLQILKDETGNPVAEVSMFRLEGGGQAVAGATVIVPLETLLPAQLTIAVDGAQGKRYGYSFCNPIGCIAQIGLTAEDIEAFKKGNAATVSLVPAPAPDQRVTLQMSLKGFTAGYDAVDVVSNQ